MFLLSWDSNDMDVRSFIIVSWVPEALFIFFFQSVFSVFTLNNFYLRCSSSLTLSSVPSFLLLSLSIELLFWLLYFISSKISIWFFFLSPAYLLRLYFFICSQCVFNCLLKYFYNGFSKTLSDNSNISSCFRYLSIDFFSSGWDFPVWQTIFSWNLDILGITVWDSGSYSWAQQACSALFCFSYLSLSFSWLLLIPLQQEKGEGSPPVTAN